MISEHFLPNAMLRAVLLFEYSTSTLTFVSSNMATILSSHCDIALTWTRGTNLFVECSVDSYSIEIKFANAANSSWSALST